MSKFSVFGSDATAANPVRTGIGGTTTPAGMSAANVDLNPFTSAPVVGTAFQGSQGGPTPAQIASAAIKETQMRSDNPSKFSWIGGAPVDQRLDVMKLWPELVNRPNWNQKDNLAGIARGQASAQALFPPGPPVAPVPIPRPNGAPTNPAWTANPVPAQGASFGGGFAPSQTPPQQARIPTFAPPRSQTPPGYGVQPGTPPPMNPVEAARQAGRH